MIRSSRSSLAPLLLLLGFEIAAIIGLQQLGAADVMRIDWSNLSGWINEPLETTVPAIVRLVALAVAYWLFLSTALFVVAQLSRIPAAIRAIEVFTLPSVRRVVDGAMAVTIATSAVMVAGAAPAHAATSAVASVGTANATGQLNFTNGNTVQYAQIQMDEGAAATPTPTPSGAGQSSNAPSGGQSGLSNGSQTGGEQAPAQQAPAPAESKPNNDTINIPAGTGTASVATPKPGQPLTAAENPAPAPADTTTTTSSTEAPKTIAVPAQGNYSVATPGVKVAAATNSTPAPTTASPDGSNKGTVQNAPASSANGTQVLGVQEHRVVQGENLWTIARDALQQTNGTAPTESQIRDYWLKVIDANRDGLRSKDPHWIFAGEVVNLPAAK